MAVILAEAGPGPGGAKGLPTLLVRIAGIPLLQRLLTSLASAGVHDILIVSGMESESLAGIERALDTNAMPKRITIGLVKPDRRIDIGDDLSLLRLARERLDGDLYLLRGDLVFDAPLLDDLNGEGTEAAAAVVSSGPGQKPIGAYLLRETFVRDWLIPFLAAPTPNRETSECGLVRLFDEAPRKPAAVDVSARRWCIVGDASDWMRADVLFSDPATALELINREFGRYQRSGAADHLVMTNVYFPTEAMRRDLRQELDALMTDYPSAQGTLARLMAVVTDQSPEHILVANGGSELIRAVCGDADRSVVVPVPTYNEYEATVPQAHLVRVPLEAPAFRLDVERLADAARQSDAGLVVVVSPNNPTGLTVPREQLEWLIEELEAQGNVRLLLDESFVDFCADPSAQSLATRIEERSAVAILKSLSMACGIPGLRLACLMTRDRQFLETVRGRLPVWNVNAVAEGFLRLLPRYRTDLARTCAQVRRECDELAARLGQIPGVLAYPSDACFCFVRLPDGVSAEAVALELFTTHRILVKSCGGKSLPRDYGYLRVKSRTPDENARFTQALADVLGTSQGQG